MVLEYFEKFYSFICSCPYHLYQYHTLFITIALLYSLKSGNMVPPALFFFLKIALIIQGAFCFHTNFKVIFSSSMKNVFGILIGVALNQSEKAMAPHSSTLAWKIPWMEEPGGLPSMGSHRVGHD